MNFLSDKCTFTLLTKDIIEKSFDFDCEHPDLNDFFRHDCIDYSNQLLGKTYCFLLDEDPRCIVCAFTVSNDSIKTNLLPNNRKKKVNKQIPRAKHFKSYPAVLIGRLGVNKAFKCQGVGKELMNFIKSWFIDSYNKTGCRFVVVDSYNEPKPIKYYKSNGFEFMFSTEEQEMKSLSVSNNSELRDNISKRILKFIKIFGWIKLSEKPENNGLSTRLMYFDLIVLSSGS